MEETFKKWISNGRNGSKIRVRTQLKPRISAKFESTFAVADARRVGQIRPSMEMKMLEKFARYPLTFGPTHIEKLERLSSHLGGKVEVYAKREDCNSGLAFGGNKIGRAHV